MKRRIAWRRISRDALAAHLRTVQIVASEAVGVATLYRCEGRDGDSIAVSLPDDEALIIDVQLDVSRVLDRRRPRGENTPLDE